MIDAAIIGAGPYGLSIAAYLRNSGISFRIFGRPMESWREHMPTGMMLKSDGFASNLYDPESALTLRNFCTEQGIPFHNTEIPVSLDTFAKYGVAFRERFVPNLEEKNVTSVTRIPEGFLLKLDDGEQVYARRVVLAVGITHFKYIPEVFSHLSSEYVTHSYDHHELDRFRDRNVAVVGAGASAIELAALLHQAGCDVQLIARRPQLEFHTGPNPGKRRSLWQRIRNPQSGLGPNMKSRFYADYPNLFRYFPEDLRVKLVRITLGPAAGWTSKKMFVGIVPALTGMTPERAEVTGGKIRLTLRSADGSLKDVTVDHVITGTGYKVNLDRLQFLSPEIRRELVLTQSSPTLSREFESSLPGLYFVGLPAAHTFGPVMRFAFGARFAAQRVTKALVRAAARQKAHFNVVEAATSATASARTERTTTN
jgi:lysine/ornithine N-monooxygenase